MYLVGQFVGDHVGYALAGCGGRQRLVHQESHVAEGDEAPVLHGTRGKVGDGCGGRVGKGWGSRVGEGGVERGRELLLLYMLCLLFYVHQDAKFWLKGAQKGARLSGSAIAACGHRL